MKFEMFGECLPIIPDPIMELIKLKDADIIELLDCPAAFCGGINAAPSSLFSCGNKSTTQ